MKNFKRSLLLAGLIITLSSSGFADDVYVKNKLFKGPIAGSGQSTIVGVEAMMKALKVEDYQVENGMLKVGDKTLSVEQGAEGPMVSLKGLKDLIGAKVIFNSDLGTVDVYQGAGKDVAARATAAPPKTKSQPQANSNKPSVVKAPQSEPGGTVVLEDSMVFGKENIVYFYADW